MASTQKAKIPVGFVIAGKYRVTGRNYDEQLRIASQLIAMLRGKR